MTSRIAAAWLLAAACAAAAAAPEQRSRVGRAHDAASGEFLYEERHTETVDGAEVIADHVRYVDPDGRAFAEKQVDFGAGPYVPAFRLEDRRHGHLESARRAAPGEVEVRYRERDGDPIREARLALPPEPLADAGFDRFIEKNWEALIAGESRVRAFLVPSRLEFLDFRIRRIDGDTPREAVRFALEIDSLLLRLVVPRMVVTYDRHTRRLLRYQGLSNLLDTNGDNHQVVIEFEYGAGLADAVD